MKPSFQALLQITDQSPIQYNLITNQRNWIEYFPDHKVQIIKSTLKKETFKNRKQAERG